MWSVWSHFAVLVVLTCCTAVPTNYDYDEFDYIMNPKPQPDNSSKLTGCDLSKDFLAELKDLRRNVTITLSVIDHQGEVLKNAIDFLIKKIEPLETTTPSPTPTLTSTTIIPDIDEKSCGIDKICVRKGQCKSEEKDGSGRYVIQFRAALDSNPCHYLEVCCPKADKVRNIASSLLY